MIRLLSFSLCMFVIVVPMAVLAQRIGYGDIKASEQKIREEAATLSLTINGKNYLYTEFPRLRDSLLSLLFAEPIPRRIPKYFDTFYESDELFREIVHEIDNLPETRETFNANATRLFLKMGRLHTPLAYDVAALYFMEHFQKYRDTAMYAVLEDVAKKYPFHRKFLPTSGADSAHYAFQMADLLLSQSLPTSVYLYSLSYDYYHSVKNYAKLAEIESRLGRVYSLQGGKAYQDKSYKHYQQSAAYYYMVGDSSNAKYSEMNSSIAMVGMQYEKKPNKSMYDILVNGGARSREDLYSENLAVAEKRSEENRIQTKRDRTVETIIKSKTDKLTTSGDVDDQYLFFTVLGCYFQDLRKRENIELAQRFFNAGLIVVLLNKPINYQKVNTSLKNLAWVYGYTRDREQALRLSDQAIALSIAQKDPELIANSYISKGNTQNILGDYASGIVTVREGLSKIDNMAPNVADMNHAQELAYRVLIYLFRNLKNTDSQNYYTNEYQIVQSLYLEELDNMNEIESQLLASTNDRNLSELQWHIEEANVSLRQKEGRLGVLSRKNSYLGLVLEGKGRELRNTIRKVGQQDSSLTDLTAKKKEALAVLSRQNKQIEENKVTIQRKNILVNTSLIAIIVLCFTVLLVVLVLRNRIGKVRMELNALAQNKMHNIQNNFSSLYKILKSGDLQKGRLYSDHSSHFFSLLASKEDYEKNHWTIADELEVLNAFLMREEILGKKVHLEDPEISPEIRVETTSFLPEIFTTIIHNSIRHGFKEVSYQPVVKIRIAKEGNFLRVLVSDNGKPSQTYIRKERPKSGLSLLRKRILNEFNINPFYILQTQKFAIEPVPGIGTTITFKFPYAQKATSTYRRGRRRQS